MVWAAKELQGHVVETYGGIRIEPIQPESGASGEGTNVGGNDPSPPKDIRNAGGEPLRARVDAIAARIREGNVAEATRLLDAFDRAVRDLQSELAARYGCFRSNRELDFFLAESPAVKVLRILDWCVAEGMFLRAFLLSHSQRFEEALSCLEGVLKIAPTHARIYGEQGFVLNRLRQPQKAAAAYTHAWELAARLPENAAVAGPALRGLAVACVDLGDLDRAEKLLQESLVVEPGNPVANNEFIYVAQRRSGLANPANTTWHGTT